MSADVYGEPITLSMGTYCFDMLEYDADICTSLEREREFHYIHSASYGLRGRICFSV